MVLIIFFYQGINDYKLGFGWLTDATYASDYSNDPSKPQLLPRTMCVDSLSQQAAMTAFASKAPIPLIEGYFQCHLKLRPAVLASIGR